MSASPGRSRCPVGVSLRRWSGRWGRRKGSYSRTGQPLPAPLSFKPSWDLPRSSRCSSTSAFCRGGCLLEEVSRGSGVKNSYFAEMSDVIFILSRCLNNTAHTRAHKALPCSLLVLLWPITSVLHPAASAWSQSYKPHPPLHPLTAGQVMVCSNTPKACTVELVLCARVHSWNDVTDGDRQPDAVVLSHTRLFISFFFILVSLTVATDCYSSCKSDSTKYSLYGGD